MKQMEMQYSLGKRTRMDDPSELSRNSDEIRDFILNYNSMTISEQLCYAGKLITKTQLEIIKTVLDLQYSDLSSLLHITDRTIHLKKGNDTFSSAVCDRVLGLIDVYSLGFSVFGDPSSFHSWLKAKNEILGTRPILLLKFHSGILAIKYQLESMKYGNL